MKRGKFITLEGLDGAGKSTHVNSIGQLIESHGKVVVRTREPGGTPLAEKIRALLLSDEMDLSTETLLIFAARQSHLNQVILPALERGDWVVCDRFTDASYAYQGAGRGVPTTEIEVLEKWVHGGVQPDLTLLFDLPYEVARQRIGTDRTLDRFEQQHADFHRRVRAAYLARAEASAGRMVVINAAQDESTVNKTVKDTVLMYCL